jgi:hypothetical protein
MAHPALAQPAAAHPETERALANRAHVRKLLRLGPDLLRDFCQAGDWLPADLRARVTQVEAKPMTSTASASHGARTVGLVTL